MYFESREDVVYELEQAQARVKYLEAVLARKFPDPVVEEKDIVTTMQEEGEL